MKRFALVYIFCFVNNLSAAESGVGKVFDKAFSHIGLFLLVVFIIFAYQASKAIFKFLVSGLSARNKSKKNTISFSINYDYLLIAILFLLLGFFLFGKFNGEGKKEYVTDPELLSKLNDPNYHGEPFNWDQIDRVTRHSQDQILHDTSYISANEVTKQAIRKKYNITAELIDVRLPDRTIIKDLPKDIKQSELLFLIKK